MQELDVIDAPARAQPFAMEFDGSQYSQADRFEAWRTINTDTFDVTLNPDTSSNFKMYDRIWEFGSLSLCQIDFTGELRTELRTGRQRRYDSETVSLRIETSGGSTGQTAGQPFKTQKGDVHIVDLGRSVTHVSDQLSYLHIYLPYEAIGYDPSRHQPSAIFRPNNPMNAMLSAAGLSLAEADPEMDMPERLRLTDGFAALVRALAMGDLAGPVAHKALKEARRQRVAHIVRARIADPGLSVDLICRSCGISRATLYRDFATEGGIHRFIRQERLRQAYRELAHSPKLRGVVTKVAYRLGFDDLGYFSRSFRQFHGISPSDAVARDRSPGETDSQEV